MQHLPCEEVTSAHRECHTQGHSLGLKADIFTKLCRPFQLCCCLGQVTFEKDLYSPLKSWLEALLQRGYSVTAAARSESEPDLKVWKGRPEEKVLLALAEVSGRYCQVDRKIFYILGKPKRPCHDFESYNGKRKERTEPLLFVFL